MIWLCALRFRPVKRSFKVTPRGAGLAGACLIGVTLAGASAACANNAGEATGAEAAPLLPVAFRENQSGGSTDSSTVTAAAPLTLARDDLYVAAVSSKPSRPVEEVIGLGLPWRLVHAQCSGRGSTGVEVWIAQGDPSGSGVVTATFAITPLNAVISVSRYSQVDTVAPIGNVVSGNTNGHGGDCMGGSDGEHYSLRLRTSVSGSIAYAAAAMRQRSHIPGNGYTERGEVQQGVEGDAASIAVADELVDSVGTVRVNGQFSRSVDWAAVALEIAPGTSVQESRETQ